MNLFTTYLFVLYLLIYLIIKLNETANARTHGNFILLRMSMPIRGCLLMESRDCGGLFAKCF